MDKLEYRVRIVTRYVVTRFYSEGNGVQRGSCGSSQVGEFDNGRCAYDVAYALCKAEHDRLGCPLDDARVVYPTPPDDLAHAFSVTSQFIPPPAQTTTTA